MEFDFPQMEGTGIEKLLPKNAHPDASEIIIKMLAYD